MHFDTWVFQNPGYHLKIREQDLFFADFAKKSPFLWFHPRLCGNLRIFLDEVLFFYIWSLPQNSWNFTMMTFIFRPHFWNWSAVLKFLCHPPKFVYAPSVTLSLRRVWTNNRKRVSLFSSLLCNRIMSVFLVFHPPVRKILSRSNIMRKCFLEFSKIIGWGLHCFKWT